jgi:hypothetical protein
MIEEMRPPPNSRTMMISTITQCIREKDPMANLLKASAAI